MVNCYDCGKGLRLIDAKPYWTRIDKEPSFLCEECCKGSKRVDSDEEVAMLMGKMFAKHNQPERSKREDLEDSLINSQRPLWDSVEIDRKFTDQDFEESKMRCSEQYRNILREVR